MDTKIETIDIKNFETTCRICLSNIETNKAHLFMEKNIENSVVTYAKIIFSCTEIKIEENDNLPNFICQNCANILNKYVWLKKTAERSNEKLIEILRKYKEDLKSNEKILGDDSNDCFDDNFVLSDDIDTETDKILNNLKNPEKIDIRKKPEIKNPQKEHCCTSCKKYFKSTKLLKAHTQRLHSGAQPYKCKQCNKCFNVRGNLNRHILIHSGVKPYKCDECPSAFIQMVQLQDHIKRHHTFEKPYSCPKCDKRYAGSLDLKRHLEIHTQTTEDSIINGKYNCGICHLEFETMDKLKSHKICHMSYSHLCSECGRSFSTKRGLNLHLDTHKEKNLSCEICGNKFSSFFKLKIHNKTHGPKFYLCSLCGKDFVSKTSLNLHLNIHSEDRPFACNEKGCGKMFKQKTSLNFHILTHTKEKKYSCDICGKLFAQTGHLYYHKQYHSGIKPHVCLLCKKSFTMKASLNTHMRRHLGERPYSCDFCKLSFFDVSSLNKHKKKLHLN